MLKFKESIQKGFTLLELIVVIVILGILATLAIPTFKTVIDKAHLDTDRASFQSLARSQVALAAFNQGTFIEADVQAAIDEMNPSQAFNQGLYAAAGTSWVSTTGASSTFGEVSYKLSPDSKTLFLATLSSKGEECLLVEASSASPKVSIREDADNCIAGATTSPEPEPEPEPTEPAVVAPTNVSASALSSGITITWDAAPGAQSYQLERSAAGAPFVAISPPEGISDLGFTDTEPEVGVPYRYIVRSMVDGVSVPVGSAPVEATIETGTMVLTYNFKAPSCPTTGNIILPVTAVNEGTVLWGDGTTSPLANKVAHPYDPTFIEANNSVEIEIRGSFGTLASSGVASTPCLTEVTEWSDGTGTSSASLGFRNAINLTVVEEIPSTLTNISSMFSGTTSFNHPINDWDVSNVTNMSNLFSSHAAFNQPLDNWNVSKVENMSSMFNGNTVFNQPLDSWQVDSLTTTSSMFADSSFNAPIFDWDPSDAAAAGSMFARTSAFNQPLEGWDMSNVTAMHFMFSNAAAFNQPLNGWNVSSVTNMSNMFSGNAIFSQPLNSWNVAAVENMSNMFSNSVFNQPLNSWNVSGVTNMSSMFSGNSVFNQPLNSWNVSGVTNMSNMFLGASKFNGSISSWQPTALKNATMMFSSASAFNQPLNSWNVSGVTNMNAMFSSTAAFNQPLNSWNVANVTDMRNMFKSATAFNQNLGAWQPVKVTTTNRADFDLGASSWVLARPPFA